MHFIANLRRAGSGFWLVALAGTIWGTAGITTQMIYNLAETNAISLSFFRLGIAAPILFLACWRLLGRGMFHIARRDLLLMMFIGILTALDQLAYVVAISYIGVAVATLVAICAAPVLVTVISALLTRERLRRRGILALLCALVGTALLTGFQASVESTHNLVLGVLVAFSVALGYAAIIICGRFLAGRCHPLQITSIGFGTGAALLLGMALATGFVRVYPPQGWLLLLYLGAVPTALGYGLFLAGVRFTPAPIASILVLMEPLTATILAALLFHEQLGPFGIFGALLLGSAIYLLASGKAA